ncbi:MAG: outer membrane protein assembly factor [Planctomycetota bacterium]
MPRRLLPILPLALALTPLPGQVRPSTPARVEDFEGKIVRDLKFKGAASPDALARYLTTRTGQPLRSAEVQEDMRNLWRRPKVKVLAVWVEPEGDGVRVVFEVSEPRSYDRVVFQGLREFTDLEVRELLGIRVAHRLADVDALDHQRVLEARYRGEGYAFARVIIERDDETSTLTFVIDEGPKVTVRRVRFRGNQSFPGTAPLRLYANLIGDAEIESAPAGRILRGSAYSEEAVLDDLERLRLYYRARGYRDAEVELAEEQFTPDFSEVDLTFRIIEGPRYRIRSVDVQHFANDALVAEPRFDASELIAELQVKPGDYYDRDLVNRDKRAIENFYGARGHPIQGRYGRAPLPSAFKWHRSDWMQPQETFDPESAEIDLVYQIVEGTPKVLRDVVIEGNTDTQDRIVRRKVFLNPGDTLDLREVDRSLQVLDALRYFQDPDTFAGARFELLPTEADDEVDLAIQVQEGDTGSFVWGAGVSTGAGVQGRIQFNKRNFDLFRPPSSFSPGTLFSEIVESKAWHGAGQELELLLAPGTEISTFRVSFYEPDLFGNHLDTIGLRVQGFRSLRILDSFNSDARGLILGLQRNFTENFTLGFSVRQESIEIEDVDANAPQIVWDAFGQNEVRSVKVQATFRDLDSFLQPSAGYDVRIGAELAGGIFGANEDFYALEFGARYYHTLRRDSLDRAHVFHVNQQFDVGGGYGDTEDLFLTERYYMGGSTLRGFDQRRAGPTQFGEPLGGEARWLSRFEYQFPLVSTRRERAFREVELLRGVLFTDMGLLGTRIDADNFSELRMSVGAGVRIHVPVLGVPIALDFALPLLYEQTDDRQILFFSLSR